VKTSSQATLTAGDYTVDLAAPKDMETKGYGSAGPVTVTVGGGLMAMGDNVRVRGVGARQVCV